MIHILWHNFRHWKIWAGEVILIGLLLIAAQCDVPQPTATPIVTANPPAIIGFTLIPPGPVPPGARIGIQVNVRLHGNRIDDYRWAVGAGEGSIISGQGTPSVTYQAPEIPGNYKVRVELKYGGGSVKDLTMVEVVEPTPTPTDTSTPTPTDTPSPDTPTPTCTVTPTPVSTDTSTPTPTDTPSPDTPTFTCTATPTLTPTVTSIPAPTDTPSPNPTSTPTATPTPTPKPDAVVNVENLHLRSGPGTDHNSMRTLREGNPLRVIGKNLAGNWLKVACSDGKEGWVAVSCVEMNIPLADVPVVYFPPTSTPTCAPTLIPTATPLPAPTLLLPEDAGRFSEHCVLLTWEWIRPLGENEYFSVRIRPEGDPEACWHPHTTATQYIGAPEGCESGKHYWSVIVARKDPESPMGWQEISRASEERWFDFFRPDEDS